MLDIAAVSNYNCSSLLFHKATPSRLLVSSATSSRPALPPSGFSTSPNGTRRGEASPSPTSESPLRWVKWTSWSSWSWSSPSPTSESPPRWTLWTSWCSWSQWRFKTFCRELMILTEISHPGRSERSARRHPQACWVRHRPHVQPGHQGGEIMMMMMMMI